MAGQDLCNSARLQGYQLVCPFSVLWLAAFPLLPSLTADTLELGGRNDASLVYFKISGLYFRTAVAYNIHHIPRWMEINKQSLGY